METASMPRQEYDHLLSLVKNRRTVRKFKPDPLPEGYVEKIIEVARWAPSGFHTQPWEFIIVQKKEVKDAIVCALDRYAPPIKNIRPGAEPSDASQPSFRDAPVFIILLADWRAKVGLPGHPTEKNALVTGIYYSSLASTFPLYAFGRGISWFGFSVVLGRITPRSGTGNPENHRDPGCPLHIRHDGARLFGGSAKSQGVEETGRDNTLR
jgi:hypothetical protein